MLYAPWTAKLEPNPADPILQGYRIRDARGIVVAEAFNRPYPVIVDQEHADTIAAAPAYRTALEAAEHWLAEEAASPHPGQTRPDDILRVIREALGKPHDARDAAPAARDDSAVLHADAVDDASQWPLPWRFETNDGASYFATEDEACAAQRDHRRRNGFDPMTGEPAPQTPDAAALMLAALKGALGCPQAAPWLALLPMADGSGSVHEAMSRAVAAAEGREG